MGRENEIVGYEKLGYVVKGRSVAYYSNTLGRVGVKKGFKSTARRMRYDVTIALHLEPDENSKFNHIILHHTIQSPVRERSFRNP